MEEQKKGMSRGCLIAIIIAAIVLVVIVALSVVCYTKRDKLMEWSILKMIETTQKDILANLPDGMTEDDAKKIISEFEQTIKDKKIKPQDLQNIAFAYQEAYKDKKMDKDEVGRLLDSMQKAVAVDTLTPGPTAPQ